MIVLQAEVCIQYTPGGFSSTTEEGPRTTRSSAHIGGTRVQCGQSGQHTKEGCNSGMCHYPHN